MPLHFYVVDAFAAERFRGNPAAVSVVDAVIEDSLMQSIAAEMNLSETAFVHPIDGGWSLRWFTPTVEVKLCGHATLASAHVLWETGKLDSNAPARFHTLSGWLSCRKLDDGWIEMDFPAKRTEPCVTPMGLVESLDCRANAIHSNGMDYLVEVEDEATLRLMTPNFSLLATLPVRGVIVTCRSVSHEFDFVSRFFAPAAGINEDPVTGSAHCALGPYWETKLGKSEFTAYQASPRGGTVKLSVIGDRVLLRGQAIIFSRVEVIDSIRFDSPTV